MLSLLKKIVPKPLLQVYHFSLAVLAAIIYAFPSNKMVVIGVTGTGGKSTTVKMIGTILEEAGLPVGWLSSLSLKILDKEWINPYHMTMLGRFKLQRNLKKMLKRGVRYAIIEVTSEGIKQFRHIGINFDVLVFTNLSPEHIETHGSFKKYRAAKLTIFRQLQQKKKKYLAWQKNKPQEKIIVANLDDKNSQYFLNNKADKKYGFSLSENPTNLSLQEVKVIEIKSLHSSEEGSTFVVDGTKFKTSLLGNFNVYNALAAITVARSLGVDFLTARKALLKIKTVKGRMEKIAAPQGFNIIIDLAHTPNSLEQVYEVLRKAYFLVPGFKNMICVLGSAGGVRDKWKRPVLGEIAGKFCDKTFITNEDPYDENPQKIIQEIERGIKKKGKKPNQDYFKIEDRKKAIERAIRTAKKGDLVVLTGKGTEATMVIGNKKIPWNERKIVEEILKQL